MDAAKPTRSEPTRDDARRNRDKILDAAAVALARDTNASLATIADAAGLSRATAYRHFPDLDAIRAALLDEAQQVGREVLQAELGAMVGKEEDQPPVLETVERVLRASLPMRHRWTMAIADEPVSDEGLIKAFAPMARAFLRRGQQTGELREDLDLDVLSEALVAMALYAVRRVHSDRLPVARAMHAVQPFIDGLRKSAERPAPFDD